MSYVVVALTIRADEYLKRYQGSARTVYAVTSEGKRIRFPANILQPFVTRGGIEGEFKIEFTKTNKFKSIRRINQ